MHCKNVSLMFSGGRERMQMGCFNFNNYACMSSRDTLKTGLLKKNSTLLEKLE